MAEKTLLDPVEKWLEEMFLGGGAETWNAVFGNPQMSGGTVTITHLTMTAVVIGLLAVICLVARRGYSGSREEAILPDEGITTRNVVEAIFDFTLDTMARVMPREDAKRYFPLIIALTLFILLSNLLGLVPGLTPPTQNFNTNIAMALSVFVCYNAIGLFRHGLAYLKEFMSPASIEDLVGESANWLAYLAGAVFWLALTGIFLFVEAFSHAFRPLSLAVRLTGNMGGDHAVLGVFSGLAESIFGVPILFPIFIMALGVVVSLVQTLVFSLLSVAYIGLAVEEGH